MRFGNPQALQLFWILVPAMIYFAYRVVIILRNATRLFDANTASRMLYPVSYPQAAVKYLLLFASMCLVIIAAARPLGKPIQQEEELKGIDIMFAIDVSSSMAATDVEPDRMEAVKNGVKNFLAGLGGDRVGMVTFAGVDFTQCPLTADYEAFSLITDGIYPGMLFMDGTALGNAIKASVDRMIEKAEKSRILILISDGENTAGISPIEGANYAKEKGIRVYTVGVGTSQGARIPEGRDAFGRVYYKTYNGQLVISKIDEAELREIAGITGGKFFRAADKNAFRSINNDIKNMEANRVKDKKQQKYEENYQSWLLWGLILFAVSQAIIIRKPVFSKKKWFNA